MCNLDLIANGHNPNHIYTQEVTWNNWFFDALTDPAYQIVMLVFAAVFLMLVSVVVLFAVMFLKNRIPKPKADTDVDADGSIHIIPFLCSVIASAMLVVALVLVIGFILLSLANLLRFNLSTLPYGGIFLYVVIMTVLFSVVQRFSPRAGKLFSAWNRIGCTVSWVFLGLCLLAFGFYWCLFLFAQIV